MKAVNQMQMSRMTLSRDVAILALRDRMDCTRYIFVNLRRNRQLHLHAFTSSRRLGARISIHGRRVSRLQQDVSTTGSSVHST
jgi:hypothetical protein